MQNSKQTLEQKIRERIKDFCLMDDEFMTVFFDDEPECTAFVLRIILEKPDLLVTEVHSQRNAPNLHERSGRLDIKATDSCGRLYDIEIQRADKGVGAKRARFNSALLDTRTLQPGEDTEYLPETYIIFITENDVLGAGKAVYHIDRTVAETGKPFGDMAHIVYVNNQYRENDSVGNLMHDFACRKAEDMKNSVLASRARLIKTDEDKEKRMSYIMEELVKEAQVDTQIETAVKMLADGKISESDLTNYFSLNSEQKEYVIKQVAQRELVQ